MRRYVVIICCVAVLFGVLLASSPNVAGLSAHPSQGGAA